MMQSFCEAMTEGFLCVIVKMVLLKMCSRSDGSSLRGKFSSLMDENFPSRGTCNDGSERAAMANTTPVKLHV